MEDRQKERELRELKALVERIKRGDCVLVLGPSVTVRPGDPDRTPLDELLARTLVESLDDVSETEAAFAVTSLRRASELYYRKINDRDQLELAVNDFYTREAATTTDFHLDLARLPFRLCVSVSPDSLMRRAFEAAGKTPQTGYYDFRQAVTTRLSAPTEGSPLIYHLFGHHEHASSLVLTEGDLIDFIVAIVKGTPAVPDQVRSILSDKATSFLFLGFGFHNWYLRVLLKVLDAYGHRSKALAFEDRRFFEHPEHAQAVGFFSGDRLIDFRQLRWDDFAQLLRDAYEGAAPAAAPQPAAARPPAANAPKAFISYASEDREAVEGLIAQLEAGGINVWQDKQNLSAGDDWDRVLTGVIENVVHYVIVVQTPAMVGRVEGVFNREIDVALKRQGVMGESEGRQFTFVLPVRLGGCELLTKLKNKHVIDIDEPSGVARLIEDIQEDWHRRMRKSSGVAA
ncbi:MAG TPA: toll/interleukin-1 receptor domain-containing protein [Thermoanaerobaculia bacterium]|nr:toll/interleukin-1 receptor domain-containing protein [Thermoanaerobaculia bacterium]